MDTDGKNSFQSRFSKLFNNKAVNEDVTEKDVAFLIELGEKNGVLLPEQSKMIFNVLDFRNKIVEDIMTHRVEIEAVEENAKVKNVVKLAIENGFSRIPVYKEDIDNIIGAVYVKDLLSLIFKDNASDKSISKFVREVLYVPESIKCYDLFRIFTEKHQHLAVIVDEYGGTSGIATLEDVVETIFGEIQDEYDNEEIEISKVNDTTFTMEGSASLQDVADALDITFDESPDYDTIGGFLVDKLGHIPDESQHPVVKFENVEFTVLVVKERHIAKVRAIKISKPLIELDED